MPLSACGSGCKEKYKMYRQFEEQKVTGECPVGAESCAQGDTSLKDWVKMEWREHLIVSGQDSTQLSLQLVNSVSKV